MSLQARLDSDLKEAMKSRDAIRRETIRGIRAGIRNREIEAGAALDDAGVVRLIRSLVKQRTDSIEQYAAAGRDELADKESAEKVILESYLPAAPDAAEIARVLREVIVEVGAESPKDLGRVMKPALARLGAAVDGKQVSQLVRDLLAE